MSSSWQRLCVASAQRPVDEFDLINFLTTGILVFFFAVTGAACARRWIQWNRLLPEAKKNLWQFYGIFCALGFLGCVAGVVAFLSLMFGNMYPLPASFAVMRSNALTTCCRSAYRTARSQLLTTRYFRNLAHFETLCVEPRWHALPVLPVDYGQVYRLHYFLRSAVLVSWSCQVSITSTTLTARVRCCLRPPCFRLAVLDRLVNFIHTVFTPDERRRLHGLQVAL